MSMKKYCMSAKILSAKIQAKKKGVLTVGTTRQVIGESEL